VRCLLAGWLAGCDRAAGVPSLPPSDARCSLLTSWLARWLCLRRAFVRLQTFLGHYRRDAKKCDQLCQELTALPDSAVELCLPQMW
jgi:hypothetical protein